MHLEAAGFNVQHLQLSWHAGAGSFAFFIEPGKGREQFLAHAPAVLLPASHAVFKRQGRVQSKFHAAVLIYGLILTFPLMLVVAFLMNTGRIIDWTVDAIPVKHEARIGDLVLAQTRMHTRLVESGPAYDAVRTIGARLTQGSAYTYRWFVAEQKEVNAFAAPGGVIVVHAGLVAQTERAEELAGVLAHEVAHIEERHSLKQLIRSQGLRVLLAFVLGDWSGSAVAGLAGNLTDLKFSRDAEMAADRWGVTRMASAGIAPHYMENFFARMAREEGRAGTLSLLATHPPSRERMEALRRQLGALPQQAYAPLPLDWPAVKASLTPR